MYVDFLADSIHTFANNTTALIMATILSAIVAVTALLATGKNLLSTFFAKQTVVFSLLVSLKQQNIAGLMLCMLLLIWLSANMVMESKASKQPSDLFFTAQVVLMGLAAVFGKITLAAGSWAINKDMIATVVAMFFAMHCFAHSSRLFGGILTVASLIGYGFLGVLYGNLAMIPTLAMFLVFALYPEKALLSETVKRAANHTKFTLAVDKELAALNFANLSSENSNNSKATTSSPRVARAAKHTIASVATIAAAQAPQVQPEQLLSEPAIDYES